MQSIVLPERFRILSRLHDGEACVGELQALLQRRQAYVSQQLAHLRGAGLVRCHRQKTFCRYSLAAPIISITLRILQTIWGESASADGVHFRVQGPILEHSVIPMLYDVLQSRPCRVGDLVVFAPDREAPPHEPSACTMAFTLLPQTGQAERHACPDLIQDVLEQAGCQVVTGEVPLSGSGSCELQGAPRVENSHHIG